MEDWTGPFFVITRHTPSEVLETGLFLKSSLPCSFPDLEQLFDHPKQLGKQSGKRSLLLLAPGSQNLDGPLMYTDWTWQTPLALGKQRSPNKISICVREMKRLRSGRFYGISLDTQCNLAMWIFPYDPLVFQLSHSGCYNAANFDQKSDQKSDQKIKTTPF